MVGGQLALASIVNRAKSYINILQTIARLTKTQYILIDPSPLSAFKVRRLRQATSTPPKSTVFSIRAGWRTLRGAITSVEISVFVIEKNKAKSLLKSISRPVGNYVIASC